MIDLANKKQLVTEKNFLKCLIEGAVEEGSELELNKIVVDRVWPRIRDSKFFDSVYSQWEPGKKTFVDKMSNLNAKSACEIEQSFQSLKQKLNEKDFFKGPWEMVHIIAMQLIQSLEEILQQKENVPKQITFM